MPLDKEILQWIWNSPSRFAHWVVSPYGVPTIICIISLIFYLYLVCRYNADVIAIPLSLTFSGLCVGSYKLIANRISIILSMLCFLFAILTVIMIIPHKKNEDKKH